MLLEDVHKEKLLFWSEGQEEKLPKFKYAVALRPSSLGIHNIQ